MKTARAVVIDEDPRDAFALLQALGNLGWSTVYVAGDDEALLPDEPLGGIRTVFLDLKLTNLPEPKQYLPQTVRVLERTVKMTPGVTGVLCWTTHDDEIPLLKEELERRSIKPAFLEAIPNKRTITESGAEGIKQLVEIIESKASALPARFLLMRWEQLLHDGACSATDSLYELAKTDPDLMKILGCIAVAAAEERIAGPESALDALFTGLSAVHIDAIESILPAPAFLKPYGEQLQQAVKATRAEPLPVERLAKLNSILLTMDKLNGTTPRPGNLYISTTWNPPQSFPINSTAAQIRGFIREAFNKRGGNADHDAFVDRLSQNAVGCVVEITPACDYANGKCPNARCVGGLLIKSPGDIAGEDERMLPADARMFAKETEFFWIINGGAALNGGYKVVLNARKLFTIPLSDLGLQTPLIRLRSPVVSDLCAWFGAHAARPGYISAR